MDNLEQIKTLNDKMAGLFQSMLNGSYNPMVAQYVLVELEPVRKILEEYRQLNSPTEIKSKSKNSEYLVFES